MAMQRTASARALVIISTIVASLVLLLATAVHALSTPAPTATVDVQVRGGDTLWSIAEEIAPEGADLRRIVSEIRELNDLPGALIHAGDVLHVPADG